ncbi:MAG: cupin domain-containing protein [Bacteroidales bacterium]|nr:cupin domain-containing protein [Bacteroidales bacterium]MBD5281512.1 cupin domain-containing protein [Bacteroides sp.]MDE6032413.1 cupin domain-containing protein [Muribaculaceae bacterium]MBD5294392.1 cupin domain-containing protein [Bacteroides sp.]MBD5342273.1 cupin domain-containing protein [Bacteroides sp.]
MLETHIKFGEVHNLTYHVGLSDEHVSFQNIFSTDNGGVSLVGFKAGQKLDTHVAPAEVMVTVLEGEIDFFMHDKPYILHAGEFLLMGADVPHSVYAKTDAKVMLVKVKP